MVSGANVGCVLHHFSSLTRWNGSRGQVWPENDRKYKNKSCLILFSKKKLLILSPSASGRESVWQILETSIENGSSEVAFLVKGPFIGSFLGIHTRGPGKCGTRLYPGSYLDPRYTRIPGIPGTLDTCVRDGAVQRPKSLEPCWARLTT